MNPTFQNSIEQWRNLKEGMQVRVKDTPLSRSEAGRLGVFIEYTPRGYARVALMPKPEWADKTGDVWLLHPEALEIV